MRNTSIPAPAASKTDSYVDVKGTRIRYVEMGEGSLTAPPLLLVHGFNGSADYWFPYTVPSLAKERRVLALDLPGNGWSGRWKQYSVDAFAGCVLDFMDALGLETVDIVGHSMGGQIVSTAVARHAERFRKLVLVSSTGSKKLRLNLFTYARMLADPCMRQFPLYPVLIRVALKGRSGRESLNMMRTTSVSNELKLLKLPTLIVWGEHDRVIPLDYGQLMAQQIPHAKFVVMKGVGHMPFYERPEEFNRLVSGFLDGD